MTKINDAETARYRRADKIAWRNIAGEVLIIHPGSAKMFPLNATASRVWEILDGNRDGRTIAREIHDRFEVDEGRALRDVLTFVADLEREGLAVRTAGTD